jgi:hypothetical protein
MQTGTDSIYFACRDVDIIIVNLKQILSMDSIQTCREAVIQTKLTVMIIHEGGETINKWRSRLKWDGEHETRIRYWMKRGARGIANEDIKIRCVSES